MKLSSWLLLLILLVAAVFSQEDGFEQHEEEQAADADEDQDENDEASQQQQRAVMAPESQEIILAETSPECYDAVHAVINGEADQKTLSEDCNKELVQGYSKTPIGQLQQKENVVLQVASLVRLSPACRREFESAAPKQADDEPGQISTVCQEDFQKQYKAMQQWIGSTTVSRMSNECKGQVSSGNVGRECEQEFITVKPGVIDTLDTQNQQKLKEPIKEEKKQEKKSAPRVKKEPKAKPWIDSSVVFLAFWTVLIGGSMVYACFLYHRDDAYHPKVEVEVMVEEEEPVELSKTKQKQLAKEDKQKAKQQAVGRRF